MKRITIIAPDNNSKPVDTIQEGDIVELTIIQDKKVYGTYMAKVAKGDDRLHDICCDCVLHNIQRNGSRIVLPCPSGTRSTYFCGSLTYLKPLEDALEDL